KNTKGDRPMLHIISLLRSYLSSLALCILVIVAGQSHVFGQKAHKEVMPGSAPFTESFQDMIQRDQQRQIIPGATPEIRSAPTELEENTGIERTIPSGNEFHAPPEATVEAPQTIGTNFAGVSLI